MDSYPVTARSLGRTYYVDGDNLERNYKNHLSDFRTWSEQNHAEDWNLLVENMGTHLSIDETSIDHVVYVFLTNKDEHGKKHTLIAYVKGLKVSDIVAVLMQIPEELRKAVIEVTMDHSDVMNAVVREVFPDARITIDCFHTVQIVGDAIEEIRVLPPWCGMGVVPASYCQPIPGRRAGGSRFRAVGVSRQGSGFRVFFQIRISLIINYLHSPIGLYKPKEDFT